MIVSAFFAVGMAAPLKREVKGCSPMYEGNLFISQPFSGHMGLKQSLKMDSDYGGKMLVADQDSNSHMEVVFSRCEGRGNSNDEDTYTGVVSLKYEDDQCLMYSDKHSENGEEVLYVYPCSTSKKQLFTIHHREEYPSMVTIMRENGKELPRATMFETSGEKDVVALIGKGRRPGLALMIENIKSL